jgi:hypothetical protein
MSFWHTAYDINLIIPPLHRRGVYCFASVRPSVVPRYFYNPTPPEGGVYCFTSVCPSVRPKIFFVTFFSATIECRNLIFGHKLHIGMPYCGKRFWTRQIPTSCFGDLVVFYAHWTYMRGYHKWAVAHSSSCFSCFSCWVEIRRQDLLMCKHMFKKDSWLKIYTFNM